MTVITKACACARSHLPTFTVSSARTERAVSEGLALLCHTLRHLTRASARFASAWAQRSAGRDKRS